MAEEEKEQSEETGGGGLGKIVLIAGVVLVAGIAGLSTYLFLLRPMLTSLPEDGQAQSEELMPVGAFEIEFPQTPVNVMREGDAPAATLLYGVTLECTTQETVDLIAAHKGRFVDMFHKLHASRTRDDLDDVLLITDSIQKQLLQKCNDLLKRLQVEPDESIRITSVLHHTFVVQDPL